MAQFEIDGTLYQSQPFDGPLQFKVALRLAPTFTAIGQVIGDLAALSPALDADTPPEEGVEPSPEHQLSLKSLSEIVMPVSRELAALPDKDVDYIVNACMAVTSWRLPTGQWKPVREADGTVLHRNNARFVTMLKITWEVIGENFAEMFAGWDVDLKELMAKGVGK